MLIEKNDRTLKLSIKDDGEGFDWEPFMQLNPERVYKANGRGIYLAGLEFDRIEYIGRGNEVNCYKSL